MKMSHQPAEAEHHPDVLSSLVLRASVRNKQNHLPWWWQSPTLSSTGCWEAHWGCSKRLVEFGKIALLSSLSFCTLGITCLDDERATSQHLRRKLGYSEIEALFDRKRLNDGALSMLLWEDLEVGKSRAWDVNTSSGLMAPSFEITDAGSDENLSLLTSPVMPSLKLRLLIVCL